MQYLVGESVEDVNLQLLKKWDIQKLNWDLFDSQRVSHNLINVIKTTCLVESRADLYSSYLLSVFHSEVKWHKQIRIWHLEEVQHGQALRKWSGLVDINFDFTSTYNQYIEAVSYHPENGISVRGSITDELIARCAIEALASGYYAAIRDTTAEPLLHEICDRLSKDEARHYGMFYKFFRETQQAQKTGFFRKIATIIKRVLELEDDQITYASFCIKNCGKHRIYIKRHEAREYISDLYPIYKKKHLYYILSFIFPLVGLRKHSYLQHFVSWILYCLVKIRIYQTWLILLFHKQGHRG